MLVVLWLVGYLVPSFCGCEIVFGEGGGFEFAVVAWVSWCCWVVLGVNSVWF